MARRRQPQSDIHVRETPIQVQDQAAVAQVAQRQCDIDGEERLADTTFPAGNGQQRRLALEQARLAGYPRSGWWFRSLPAESRRRIAPESHFNPLPKARPSG